MRGYALFFSALLVLAFGFTAAQGQTWNIQLVDDAGDAGYYSQIVTLSNGMPCIAFKESSTIRIARWVEDGGQTGWVYRQMATSVYGQNFKMVVDDQDHLHFLCTNGSYALTYGVFDVATDSWIISWTSTGITGCSGCHIDLCVRTFGADRIPYMAVANGSLVRMGRRDPGTGTWTVETVADATHQPTGAASIAVDSAGGVHVAYCEYTGEYNLNYVVKPAGSTTWMLQTVDPGGANVNVGEYASILIDQSDVVHIAYYDRTNHDLKYATPVAP
jgi:hypothetical protein